MLAKLRPRLTYANVVSSLCLFIVLGGTSYAVATGSIDSREIKNNTVRSKDIRNNDVRGKDIRAGTVKSSDVGNGALLAEDFKAGQLPAGPRGPQGPRGNTGQPPAVEGQTTVSTLGAGWTPYDAGTPVRYFKDPAGVVHLQGGIKGGTPGRTTPLFTLPPGYRPAASFLEFAPLSTSATDTPASSMVEICGNVNCGAGAEPDPGAVFVVQSGVFYQSLDGVSFRAGS